MQNQPWIGQLGILKLGILLGIGAAGMGLWILQAGGWANWKLRHSALAQHFTNQQQELNDLRSAGIDPNQTTRVSLNQILNGGPPKDGIPSIDQPRFDRAATTPFAPEETVIGLVINGEAVAYPYGIMNWHEIVNDRIGGQNITVSYCPLCDTTVAFQRGDSSFGVSGKLYQSCLVLYDRSDDSLYAQPWGQGIVGPAVNQVLERIPTTKTTLGQWLAQHPNSKILSTETGHQRRYLDGYPYGSYHTDDQLLFPVRGQNQLSRHPKDIVSYTWEPDGGSPRDRFSGYHVQFPHDEIKAAGEKQVEFGDRTIRARWQPDFDTVVIEELDGTPLPSSTAYAFVYAAFFAN